MQEFDFQLSPTNDVIFQFIFSSKDSEKCLLPFINAIQLDAGKEPIKSVEIKNPFDLQRFQGGKKVILDIQTDMEFPNAYRPGENPGYNTQYRP